jgi:hypothetical protein
VGISKAAIDLRRLVAVEVEARTYVHARRTEVAEPIQSLVGDANRIKRRKALLPREPPQDRKYSK